MQSKDNFRISLPFGKLNSLIKCTANMGLFLLQLTVKDTYQHLLSEDFSHIIGKSIM